MVNTTPRRTMPARQKPKSERPWEKGDPTKRIGLNTPIPEPLMLQLDWLIENKVIYSKASFIREVVAEAAEKAIQRTYKVREAVKRIEAEDRKK